MGVRDLIGFVNSAPAAWTSNGQSCGGTLASGSTQAFAAYLADSAFHWWTALSPMLGCDPVASSGCQNRANSSGWNDGLIYYDPNYASNGNQSLYVTKRYYGLAHYSRFVWPGAVRHNVTGAPSGVQVSAFDHDGAWTLVVNNLNNASTSLTVRTPTAIYTCNGGTNLWTCHGATNQSWQRS
ncbi:hypothetical protein [Micromonospora sp. CPCC 206061]|uniref:hypothetical protein n=1 Tax=Micromonospora sp. CPCC 206061 TaxID=3122410 RepID=UPI002FEF0319